MSTFSRAIAIPAPFARSVAVAALMSATMLASPLTAARADDAAGAAIQQAPVAAPYPYPYPVVVGAAQTPVNLGKAGYFAILSKTGITTTGTTKIVGNIGVSPIASTAITGFGLVLDKSGTFSKSALVTGRVYAANYAPPTPSMLTTAVSNMQAAYNNAAGRKNPNAINLGGGNIGGQIIGPGLYKWTTGVTIPTDVTLSGSSAAATSVWIFQIAGTLEISSGTKVILSNGALPRNIFWQVSGQTVIGTTAVFNGNILDKTGISLQTGATMNGRALAQTAVTLEANAVTLGTVDIENNHQESGDPECGFLLNPCPEQ